VPRSPQGGRRNERSLTSTTPWRSAVPPPPSPQGPGGTTADFGSGQTPAAWQALRCRPGTAGGIVPSRPRERSVPAGFGRRRPSGFGPAGPVERSSKSYLGGEQSPWKMGRHCSWQQRHGVPTRQRSNASKAAVSRGGWRAALATERLDSCSGTGRRVRGGPFRRIRAHPVDPVPRIPAALQRRASAVRVLRGPHERWNVTGATAVVTPSGCWRGNLRGV
jgi:hypothetical protein